MRFFIFFFSGKNDALAVQTKVVPNETVFQRLPKSAEKRAHARGGKDYLRSVAQ